MNWRYEKICQFLSTTPSLWEKWGVQPKRQDDSIAIATVAEQNLQVGLLNSLTKSQWPANDPMTQWPKITKMCYVLSVLIYFDHPFIRVLESMGDDRFCFRKKKTKSGFAGTTSPANSWFDPWCFKTPWLAWMDILMRCFFNDSIPFSSHSHWLIPH